MTTKTYLLLAACLSLSIITKAQSWYSFAYNQPIAKYRGLPFKLEASVKVDMADEFASARLWLRVDKKNGYGFFENMWKKPIRNAQWKTYAIEGKVDDEAENVAFGTLSEFSGNFYYDDFKLSIKNLEGVWEVIYQTGFENGSIGWEAGIFSKNPDLGRNKFFIESIEDSNSKEHNKYLKITGTKVPNYGHNKEAGKYAKVNGINLYYEIYGSGKPLVILHGNGGSISNAEPHLGFFKEKYKVIAIDSRGQGNSIDDTTALTYDLMASDVNQLLEQLHIDSAYVWGHSDGAILALILAKDYPKKVSKAIAYAANLTPDTLGLAPVEFEKIEEVVKTSRDPKEKQLNTMMYKYPHIPFEDLHKIKAQVLIMSGDNDMIPLEHTLMIYKNIKKSNLCVLPAATHGGAWENPKLFQEIAIDFFEKPFQK
jgi:pimeloyl-ACP methyl ester carboxylesterase